MPVPSLAWIAVLAAALCACDPTVIIGTVVHDAGADGQGDAQGDSAVDAQTDATLDGQQDAPTDGQGDGQGCPGSSSDASPVADPDASIGPFATGFENGFCGYASPTGFCYTAGPGSYSIVTSPVHSGKYAAAFTTQGLGDAGVGPGQARCVEQGVFPSAAYLGAWYYVPSQAVNSGTLNLFHYQGGVPGGTLSGLWDVSLVNTGSPAGPLHVVLFDFMNGTAPSASGVPPIPIDQWFHLEVYFKRATDTTGALTLLQDGVTAASLTGLVTDPTNWGQWYVGTWTDNLMPSTFTVYVDDVTVSLTP